MSKRSKSAGNTIEQKRQRIQVDNNANEEVSFENEKNILDQIIMNEFTFLEV